MLTLSVDDFHEVLRKSLSRTEGAELLASLITALEEGELQTMAPDVVSEPLHTLLWPSLDAFEELSLVLVMELLDASLELNLSGAKWVNLLELL